MVIRKVEILKDEEIKKKIPSVYALAKAMNVSHSYAHRVINNEVSVSYEQYIRIRELVREKFEK